MKYYLTIDGGTTNTRVSLLLEKSLLGCEKIPLGAKDCQEGTEPLKTEIEGRIDKLCLQNNLNIKDITAIIASGMITSEYGICPISHLCAPVGIYDLHKGIKRVDNSFFNLPCYFIPGVKIESDDPLLSDMMRGEETEIMGISDRGDEVYLLPGSHSKQIYVDKDGKICKFSTMLTGEMIFALAGSTILSSAINLDCHEIDEKYLLYGFDAAGELGINAALFKVRILKNLYKLGELECYSFFMGIVLSDEVFALKKSGITRAVIGGKAELREPMASLLKSRSEIEVKTISDEESALATAIGAIKIYEYEGM